MGTDVIHWCMCYALQQKIPTVSEFLQEAMSTAQQWCDIN